MLASKTAKKPRNLETEKLSGPAAIKAPTMITDEMAFVTDIKGE